MLFARQVLHQWDLIIIQLFTQKEFMNKPQQQTGLSHQMSNGDGTIRPLSPKIQQNGKFCISCEGQVAQKGKNCMGDYMGLDSDQSSLDSQSSLSFQSCDPLEGHKMVLQNLISKNYILLSKYSQLINQQFPNSQQSSNPIFKTLRLQQYLDMMLAKFRKFKPAVVLKFEAFLETENNFYKFLLYFYHSFSDIVVAKAMKLVFYIWELYVPYHSMKLEPKNIQILSSLITQKICQNEFKLAKKQILANQEERQSYRQIIEILTMTVILVIQECSENPYLDSSGSISESVSQAQIAQERREEEQSLDVCYKKIKGQRSIYFSQ